MYQFPYDLIDLTHTLDEDIPTWSGSCGFRHVLESDYSENPREISFRVHEITMKEGIGTHIDAPAHCSKGGATIDALSLSQLIVPTVMIALPFFVDGDYSVKPQDIEVFERVHGKIQPGSLVLISTGWEQFWVEPEKYRNNYTFPFVSAEAAVLLLERGVVGLGIDTLSPDRPESGFKIHQLFLSAGKYIIENAAHLRKLPPQGSFVAALPLKIKGGTESPIRLIGLVEKGFSENGS